MAINERLIHTAADAAGGTGNQEEGLILHLDANDVDSYDGNGSIWYDITNHEYTPAVDPAENFNTVTYSSNNRAVTDITGVGFKPDLVWIKDRDTNGEGHVLVDSVRGISGGYLRTEGTSEQYNTYTDSVTAFIDDGFTVGADTVGKTNYTGRGPYVAWCFKAGGAAVSNTDGTVTSQVSVNNDLGFSIVKFATSGGSGTVGHGLDVPPEVVLMKRTNTTSDWYWFYNGGDNLLRLNTTADVGSDSTQEITSTTFKDWASSGNFIAYCFASKRGVSKVGTYTGTGGAGNKVYTGFQPAWIMFKRTDSTGNWQIVDNERGSGTRLYADLNNNEDSGTIITFNGDGFTINGTGSHYNADSGKYIYLAFAAKKSDSLTPDRDGFTEDSVTSGFEVELKANDYSGSGNWLDSTSNDNDGTISGATYVNDGESDYFDFDGQNDYIDITATNTSPLNFTDEVFSIETWVNIDAFSILDGIISRWNNGGFQWRLNTGDTSPYTNFEYVERKTNNTNSRFASSTTLETNRWYHLVVTRSATQVTMYIDGVQDFQSSATGDIRSESSSPIRIGHINDGDLRLNGKIAQVRIYSKTLSAAEVKTNYDAGKGLYTYPELELHLDAGNTDSYDPSSDGSTWSDLTSSNADVTLTSMNASQHDKEIGGWFSFDGSADYGTITNDAVKITTGGTYEFWIRPANTSQTGKYILAQNSSNNNWGYSIQQNGTALHLWSYQMTPSQSYVAQLTASSVLTANKWHHVVVSIGDTAAENKIYVDGDLKATEDTLGGTLQSNSNTLYIGTYYPSVVSSTGWAGDLGQLRLYDSILTADEVMQNYRFTKNDYPNGIHFTNAGGRANWLSEGSWNFDSGANEYFTHTTGAFKGRLGTGNFAVSAWVKPDEVTSDWRVIIGNRGYSDGSSNGWQLYANQDDIKFWGIDGSSYELVTLNSVLSAGTWVHVLIQRTDSAWEGYINGSLSTNSSSNSAQLLTSALGNKNTQDSDLIIGRNYQTNAYQWDGKISDIKIFNKALTAAEITAEYNKGQFGAN